MKIKLKKINNKSIKKLSKTNRKRKKSNKKIQISKMIINKKNYQEENSQKISLKNIVRSLI